MLLTRLSSESSVSLHKSGAAGRGLVPFPAARAPARVQVAA